VAGGGELGAVGGGLGPEDGRGNGPVGVCGDGCDEGGQDRAEGAGRDGIAALSGQSIEFGFDGVDFQHDGGDAGVLGEGGGEEGEGEEHCSGKLETHSVCVLGVGVSCWLKVGERIMEVRSG
jgi:hypothetical protein